MACEGAGQDQHNRCQDQAKRDQKQRKKRDGSQNEDQGFERRPFDDLLVLRDETVQDDCHAKQGKQSTEHQRKESRSHLRGGPHIIARRAITEACTKDGKQHPGKEIGLVSYVNIHRHPPKCRSDRFPLGQCEI